MRPVVLQMGVTLDGFVHGAKGYEDWGLPPEDEEVVAWKVASLREASTHIMGRATYEAMASVWPNTTKPALCASSAAKAGTASSASRGATPPNSDQARSESF